MFQQPVKRKHDVVGHDHAINSFKCLKILEGLKTSGPRYICVCCRQCSATIPQIQHTTCNDSGHELILDTHLNALFCIACSDYVYVEGFDNLKKVLQVATSSAMEESVNAEILEQQPSGVTGCFNVVLDETSLLSTERADGESQPGFYPAIQPLASDGFPSGLRGLNNMGNTCFMNSVLQGLIHAPMLRNHFLLGCHIKSSCSVSSDGGFCVSCELDDLINEAYCGARTAYSPAQFLYTWWMLAGSHLGSYQQHDAHEFFLFVLEMLNDTPGAGNIGSRVFEGILRSDVICSSCGHVSTTQDPFTHLSMDIPPREQLVPLPILPRPSPILANSKCAAGTKAVPKVVTMEAKAARHSRQEHAVGENRSVVEAATHDVCPFPSSSLDNCSSSEGCEEAAGSTLQGPLHPGVGGNFESRVQQEQNLPFIGRQGAGRQPSPAALQTSAQQELLLQQEAASAVGGASDSEDARDTLSSPKASLAEGQAPGPARRGRGRPPIPRAGRGGRRSGGRGRGRRKAVHSESEAATLAAASSGDASWKHGLEQISDAIGASSNLPGAEQGPHGHSKAATLPPQLAGYQRWPAASLLGCLHRFVRKEELGTAAVKCARCGSQHAHKQLSLRSLPPVLVLHAKRFEHRGGVRATARKLDTDLSFPLSDLDMRPFLSATQLRARHGLDANELTPSSRELLVPPLGTIGRKAVAGKAAGVKQTLVSALKNQSCAGNSEDQAGPGGGDFLYNLYAVVCHRGNFQGGHYVSYVRAGDGRWYLCDDAWVVEVDESVVKTVQAYMLFYIRKALDS